MKTTLFESLGISQRGCNPLERLAGQIVVALEMRHVQKTLNYAGVGEWNAYRGELRPRWGEFVKVQTGFTEDTQRNLDLCAEAVEIRLAADSLWNEEAKITWKLMKNPPSELSECERQRLVQGIFKYALREGDTRQSLINEIRPARLKMKVPAVPDPEAAKRGEEAPIPGTEPNNRFLDLVAFCMSQGLGMKRAREVAVSMLPDEMLTPDERSWKKLRRQLADNFFETVDKRNTEQ